MRNPPEKRRGGAGGGRPETLSCIVTYRTSACVLIFSVLPLILSCFGRYTTSKFHLGEADSEAIHSSCVILKTHSQPRPKPVPRRVRHSASSFNCLYPLFSSRSSSSCFRLFPRLPVTSTLPSMFPSITCFRRQSRSGPRNRAL